MLVCFYGQRTLILSNFCRFYKRRFLSNTLIVRPPWVSIKKEVKIDRHVKHATCYSSVDVNGNLVVSRNHPLSVNPETIPLELVQGTPNSNNSVGARMKLLVQQYGSIAMIFHVTLSLTWLGATYSLVSNGLDLGAVVQTLGLASEGFKAKLAGGASTFVVAYSIHKCFAMVRLTITATCVPLLVSLVFWCIHLYDRNIAYPSELERIYPLWRKHLLYVYPLYASILLVWVNPSVAVSVKPKRNQRIFLVFLLVYANVLMSRGLIHNQWVYSAYNALSEDMNLFVFAHSMMFAAAVFVSQVSNWYITKVTRTYKTDVKRKMK